MCKYTCWRRRPRSCSRSAKRKEKELTLNPNKKRGVLDVSSVYVRALDRAIYIYIYIYIYTYNAIFI